MNIETKIIMAKALRISFNKTQSELLKDTFWGDDNLIKMVKNMQEEYKIFSKLANEIEEENKALYESEILGL